jgi:hypothetical protein
MNDKLTGIIYILIAILIIAVRIAVPNFFDYLIIALAVVLIIAGIYLLLFKRY